MVTPHELLNFFRVVRLDDKFVDGSAFILQRDNYGICLSYNMGGTLSIGGSKNINNFFNGICNNK